MTVTCKYCGKEFIQPNHHWGQCYCSDACRNEAKKIHNQRYKNRIKRERKMMEAMRHTDLSNTVREIEKYNQENGTSLTYGQYISLRDRKQI